MSFAVSELLLKLIFPLITAVPELDCACRTVSVVSFRRMFTASLISATVAHFINPD